MCTQITQGGCLSKDYRSPSDRLNSTGSAGTQELVFLDRTHFEKRDFRNHHHRGIRFPIFPSTFVVLKSARNTIICFDISEVNLYADLHRTYSETIYTHVSAHFPLDREMNR